MIDDPSYFLHANDPTGATKPAPTAADAAVLQLAEAASSKQSSHSPALPPHIRDDATGILIDAARDLAVTKNVRLAPGQEAEIADMALVALPSAITRQLAACGPAAIARAAGTLNFLLDTFAACQVIQVLRELQGVGPLDPAQTFADATAWVRQRVTNDIGDQRYRWPDPIDMAHGHLKARSSGPVSITFPGVVRAAYFLDPSRLRSSTTNPTPARPPALADLSDPTGSSGTVHRSSIRHSDGFMPEPLLIRCPGISPVNEGESDHA